MKRLIAVLLLAAVLSLLLSPALAGPVACPTGGFSLVLPDSFAEQSFSSRDDPDLCFYWSDGRVTVQAYAAYLGEVAGSDLFQVLTGSETDSGLIMLNGMNMLYAAGMDPSGAYLMYSWMDRGNNVTIYFYYPADDASCPGTVSSIMSSIAFDAGH